VIGRDRRERYCRPCKIQTMSGQFLAYGQLLTEARLRVRGINLDQSCDYHFGPCHALATMVLKLVGNPLSTCTHRVVIFLIEKGVLFEPINIDFSKGEHKSLDFLAKQPFGHVPEIVRSSPLSLVRVFQLSQFIPIRTTTA
jgi:hypothetical protein